MKATIAKICALASVLLISLPAKAQEIAPETTSGLYQKELIRSQHAMVVTANPLATEAGHMMLAKGGNALDAAIAAQLVLNVVEPQSSGIGGGGFLLWHDAKTGRLFNYDGRETAPENVDSRLFMDDGNDSPLHFAEVFPTGRAVGVPGLLAMLAKTHSAHGVLPWPELFKPAIELAKTGFAMSHRLYQSLSQVTHVNFSNSAYANIFLNTDQTPKEIGSPVVNEPLAKVLEVIAKKGIDPFYRGDIAKRIVKAVRFAESKPGTLTLDDMKRYQAKLRPSLCNNYKSYKVCSMGPPSSGGITVLQILGILDNMNMPSTPNAHAWHMFIEASKRAYADRNYHIGDSDFVDVPHKALLNPAYLQKRAGEINPVEASSDIEATQYFEHPSTTHLSIVDSVGNIVSLTSSVEHAFGSGIMVDGFFLNNQLTDFSFVADKGGRLVPNRVEGSKRPRSSMSPTIVYDKEGKIKMVVGSPGGSRIISYVAQAIVAALHWDVPIQEAVSMPHIVAMGNQVELEQGYGWGILQRQLSELGHVIKVRPLNSGIHAIVFGNGIYYAGVDPRREGSAKGL